MSEKAKAKAKDKETAEVEVKVKSRRWWPVILCIAVALLIGIVGGTWYGKRAGGASVAPAAKTGQLWTCGMHPGVIQSEPGNCPICGMKLTPMRMDQDGEDKPGGPRERSVLYWRAPMDPNYVSDKPGKSPMGMDLVPVYADEDETPVGHTIRIDPITIQNMGVRTAALKRGPLVKTIRTVGRVDYDEERVTFINTKFEGWIEKLFVDETGQHVAKGQALFEVYSPQLYSAQEEYLASLRALKALSAASDEVKEDARQLLEAGRIKLRFQDVSDEQIDELAKTNKAKKSLVIHSPAEGIVTEKMILEGMYVKPGMQLYTIADLSHVWVYVDIYEYQLPWVRTGQTATMNLSYIPGKEFIGKVVYIYPYLEKQTRVIKVRLEFDNTALELKPDMFATIMLKADLGREAVLIPREAYIDSGLRKVAFVDLGGGKFQPRQIQVGVEAADGMVEVLHGLDAGDVVVTSGQFMLDAESKLKEAVAKMQQARRVPVKKKLPPETVSEKPSAATQPTTMPADSRFACPMAKHPFEDDPARMGPYFSSEPGTCPWCEMTLKPIDELDWTGKYKPAATMPAIATLDIAAYACPMSAHPDQADPSAQGPYFALEPGKCPRCGMGLKPIDELGWARALKSAKGADVAYTCPDHQHVFSHSSGKCPRCGRELEMFKAMYTCPDPAHSEVISISADQCPHDGKTLVPFRGIWLAETMAEFNVPPNGDVADLARYRCPVHPLVHSDEPGGCTICAAALEPTPAAKVVTAKPVVAGEFLCPMHPQIRSGSPGPCPICAMQLVSASLFKQPATAPARVQLELDHVAEHYLTLQRLLAADSTANIARNALGIASAAKEMLALLPGMDTPDRERLTKAVENLHAAALKINGTRIDTDRIHFVDLSAAMIELLEHLRPDQQRWPKLYIFHCPMSKGDWVQTTDRIANPYYGFKMLKCGNMKKAISSQRSAISEE